MADDDEDDIRSYQWTPENAVRPRDAASLVLIREGDKGPEILMGQRHPKHAFMPRVFVFPGGRIDPADSRVRPATALKPEVAARLGRATPSGRARAAAVAAVRETFEETGLMLAKPGPAQTESVTEIWGEFLDKGMGPALDELDALARAITPAQSPIRFHARFFVAEVEHLSGEIGGSGELENIAWIPVSEAMRMSLADITELVAGHAAEWFANRHAGRPSSPVPLYCYRHGERLVLRR